MAFAAGQAFPPPHSQAPGYAASSLTAYHHPPPPLTDAAGYSQAYDLHYIPHPPNPAAVHVTPEQQAIHTLFVSGLPDDVKPREIHNLFRRRTGFESCQLKYTGRGDQVVAFATFINHHSAMAAMSALDGKTFDPQTGAKLHVELARSNSRTKRPRGDGAYTVIDKRVKATTNDDQEIASDDGDGGSDEASGTDSGNYGNTGDLAAAPSGEAAANTDDSLATTNGHSQELAAGEIPSCSTLFIANLGPNCTEEELKQVLSEHSGFRALKMKGRGGMPVAFADFTDATCSTEAMKKLQDTSLPSSDRGGMHLEYARSKMRKG